jgi:tRNA(fMet)-specific endonuclease VapC
VTDQVALLDSDTLSEIARGHARIVSRARDYLVRHGRFTISAVTLFERLRGYRAALLDGKPYQRHLSEFEAFASACVVIPFDDAAADRSARAWAGLPRRARSAIGDLLIAGTASANGLPLVTRNRRDFQPIAKALGGLTLIDWAA